MDQQIVIVLVGLQASGKSTWSRQFLEKKEGWVYISKDKIKPNKQKKMMKKINAALKEKQNVLVDNTNPSVADREPIIDAARSHECLIHCYNFPTNLDACLRRNEQREPIKRVPPVGMFHFLRLYMNPSFDEGFDRIVDVEIVETIFRETERLAATSLLSA